MSKSRLQGVKAGISAVSDDMAAKSVPSPSRETRGRSDGLGLHGASSSAAPTGALVDAPLVTAAPESSDSGLAVKPKTVAITCDEQPPKQETMSTMISIQSLLVQFAHHQVRADFINGCFGCNVNPNLLPRIDEIRWLLLPRWLSGNFSPASMRSQSAAYHFSQLIERSDDLLLTDTDAIDECLTYKEWFTTLSIIASNRYWSRTPPENRCTHILGSDGEASISVSGLGNRISEGSKHSKKTKSSLVKSTPMKVEEIIISSSSARETETDTDEGGEESEVDAPSPHYYRHRNRSDSRSVVTPPVFQMDGKVSLRDFFATYENYFSKKFKGDSHDQSQMLSRFLTGDLLKVYEVRGGRKLRYEAMKVELLAYYKKQKIGGKTYWRKELSDTIPAQDENYDIFGMRLAELAELAYPSNKKECATHLRRCFLKALPPTIRTKISDAERALKATTNGKSKYLSFSVITQMAKDLQREGSRHKTVMWASELRVDCQQPSSVACDSEGSATNSPIKSREFRSRQRSSRRPNEYSTVLNDDYPRPPTNIDNGSQPERTRQNTNSNGPLRCSYCQNTNHRTPECWRASKLCLICGKGHFIEDCPKFDPNYRSRSKSRSRNFRPSSSLN